MEESPLEPLEQRVLGVLLEKELSTPEYYPLTLNALVNGCNQSSNRDPVMQVGEAAAQEALERLRDARLAGTVQGGGIRVVRFRPAPHRGPRPVGAGSGPAGGTAAARPPDPRGAARPLHPHVPLPGPGRSGGGPGAAGPGGAAPGGEAAPVPGHEGIPLRPAAGGPGGGRTGPRPATGALAWRRGWRPWRTRWPGCRKPSRPSGASSSSQNPGPRAVMAHSASTRSPR